MTLAPPTGFYRRNLVPPREAFPSTGLPLLAGHADFSSEKAVLPAGGELLTNCTLSSTVKALPGQSPTPQP